ncbi:MAG: tRNA (adenosine(37)-N6)-threonylcarbamoyltransferase complex ATPase subunit type 1 TsaE [Oscillospiraceae bacterium]|nr:tRNA (adenosine(37)-N6)-threonylcarbamoyltransferase complex ATPase subunit type 1 TsaE [Oscillospiraceae bacterium]
MQFITRSPEETEQLGERLGKRLRGGEVIAFLGGLGAGKTAFTRGLARGLDIPMRVTSPTYTIVNEYTGGRLPLFHFDMYRLESEDDLFDIGWEDYLLRGGVCAVEWSENVRAAIQDAITVRIDRLSDEERKITIEGGEEYADSGI